MKKNITINLTGQLFAIDEDAYDLLLNYTETLRRYYRRQAEGEEVVDDIEVRIAELFGELQSQGYNAITIEHVQNIIQRIGKLEDLTSSYYEEGNGNYSHTETDNPERPDHIGAQGAATAAGEAVRGAWNKMRSGKRFYRDTENKMLGGVLAGCSKYFGGDVVIWRIVFLCLMLLPLPFVGECTGTLVLIYIIMAIIAPAASTPEERLKMRGEEVNPQNLAEEVNRETTACTTNDQRAQRRHTISIICAIVLFIFSVWMWIGFIGVLCGSGVLWIVPEFIVDGMISNRSNVTSCAINDIIYSIFYILVAVAFSLFTLGYCSMHTGLALLDKVKAMGLKERITWLAVFVVSVVCIVMASVNCAATINDFNEAYPYSTLNNESQEADVPARADSVNVDSVATSVASDTLGVVK